MGSDRRLGTIAVILGVVAVAATVRCVVVGEPARFLGLAAPGAVGVQAVWLGTALAGPVPMAVALIVAGTRARAGSRGAAWVVAGLMAGAFVGMLGEAITYRVLTPGGFDVVPATFVVVNLMLPVAALVVAAGGASAISPRVRSGPRAR
jgi:hypothetical protein